MSFKMKGSPASTGGIQGTSSHASALKMVKAPLYKKKVDTEEYKGETESSTANRNISKGKQEKQRTYVEGINEKLGSTRKEKKAQKRVMNKSEKIRKRETRQSDREDRTGKKEGTGIVGKIRKKVIDYTQKATTKKINKNMDKLTSKQAFNTARRYVPGETYTYKGKSGKSEKVRGKDKKGTDNPQSEVNFLRKDGQTRTNDKVVTRTFDFKDKNKNGVDDRDE